MNPDETNPFPESECEVWLNGLPAMAGGANMSFDWGGGGQISTAHDLCRFLDGLLAGALFRERSTLDAMTAWIAPPGLAPPRVAIGLGLQQWKSPVSGSLGIGHAGAWGARLWRDPRTGATVAGTVNQSDPGLWAFEVLDEAHRRSIAAGGAIHGATMQREDGI
jgi:CubicO group peptidase (beta-lactamase class C family)